MRSIRYKIKDKFLYEILEDYQDAGHKLKIEIFNVFCDNLWKTNNIYEYDKHIKFTINGDMANSDIGEILNKYSDISYKSYNSRTNHKDYLSLIRQTINNIYVNYCCSNIILNEEYLNSLKYCRNLFFRWKSGFPLNIQTLESDIQQSIEHSKSIKDKFTNQKIHIDWEQYTGIINGFLKRIFDNYTPNYKETTTEYGLCPYDLITDDNMCVKYITTSIKGYFKNYSKEYYGQKRGRNKSFIRCEKCGSLVIKKSYNQKYCQKCSIYQPIKTKQCICIDCGNVFFVDARNTTKIRCNECQNKHQTNLKSERNRKYYLHHKNH